MVAHSFENVPEPLEPCQPAPGVQLYRHQVDPPRPLLVAGRREVRLGSTPDPRALGERYRLFGPYQRAHPPGPYLHEH